MNIKLGLVIVGVITAGTLFVQNGKSPLFAQEAATSAATPTTTNLDDKVKVLKEKIENKVAEISKSNRAILEGEIASLEDTKIKIKLADGTIRAVNLDKDFVDIRNEISAKKVVFKDLEKGDYITIYGVLIDTDITANRIYLESKLVDYVGQIVSVNKDFSIDVVTNDQEQLAVDIEKDTQQQILGDDFTMKKVGFTKYKEGYKIHLIGEHTDGGKRVHAKRILLIPTTLLE